ncbi:MAG TPA: nuclear transport factor 2 family protein [Candidatus Binatia bacterium]|jgi:hypothetical protein
MNDIEAFARYAAAFEAAFVSDDWKPVRESFSDDAVYEVAAGPPFGGTWSGRDQIVDHLIESVNSFDRLYDERLLEPLSGPEIRDGAVFVAWAVTYRKKGEPDLRVTGEERAWIRDGKIVRLEDSMPG